MGIIKFTNLIVILKSGRIWEKSWKERNHSSSNNIKEQNFVLVSMCALQDTLKSKNEGRINSLDCIEKH